MLSPSYSITPKDFWNTIATRDAPQLVDVRRRDAYEQSPHLLPGAVWRDPAKASQWAAEFDASRPLVAACKAGHEMSQMVVAQLRVDGTNCLLVFRTAPAVRVAGRIGVRIVDEAVVKRVFFHRGHK